MCAFEYVDNIVAVLPESLTVHAFRQAVSLQYAWWTSWAIRRFSDSIVATFELLVVVSDLEPSNNMYE